MKPIKAAIFDMDGTILDSMGIWAKIDIDFLNARGLEVPDDYMEKVGPMSYQEMAEYTIQRFHLDEKPESLIQEWDDRAVAAYSGEVRLKDGAMEYLLSLKEKGVKLALATASGPPLFGPALKNNGIYHLFDDFPCGGMRQRQGISRYLPSLGKKAGGSSRGLRRI